MIVVGVKNSSLILFVFFAMLLISAGEVSAIIVNPGDSIQAAIDSLAATGGIVELMPGTHTISIVIRMKSNVSVTGSTSKFADTIITTTHSGVGTPNKYSTNDGGIFIIYMAENVSIKNLTTTRTNDLDIQVRQGNNILIENVYVGGRLYSGMETTPSEKVNNLTVRNSVFNLIALMKNLHNTTFENNLFTGSSTWGLDLQEGGDYITVRNNTFTGNQQGFRFYVNNKHVYVYDNRMVYNTMHGVQWKGNSHSILRNNNISYNGQLGIQIHVGPYSMSNNSISNNIISNNGGAGLSYITEGGTLTSIFNFTNNVVYKNLIGLDFNSIASGSTMYVKNNIITDNLQMGVKYAAGNVNLNYNDVWNNLGGDYSGISPGTTDISLNPLFYNSASGDFHLKSQTGRWDTSAQTWVTDSQTSPAIDAGDPISSYSLEPSPNGGRINMGAYGGTNEASKSPPQGPYVMDCTDSGSDGIANGMIIVSNDGTSNCNADGTNDEVEIGYAVTNASGKTVYIKGSAYPYNISGVIYMNTNNVVLMGDQKTTLNLLTSLSRVFETTESGHHDMRFSNFILTSYSALGSTNGWFGWRDTHGDGFEGVSNYTVEYMKDYSTIFMLKAVSPQSNGAFYGYNITFQHNRRMVSSTTEGAIFMFMDGINVINNSGAWFIDLNRNIKNGLMENNSFVASNANYILRGHGGNNWLIRNNVFNNMMGIGQENRAAIGIDGGTNYTYENNTISANSACIRFENGGGDISRYYFNNNIMYGCTYGVKTKTIRTDTHNVNFTNNVFYGATIDGIHITDTNYFKFKFTNNIILNSSNYNVNVLYGTLTNFNYNDVYNGGVGNIYGSVTNTGTLYTDPLFADPTNHDFHLKSQAGRYAQTGWVYTDAQTSPAIAAGDPTSDNSKSPWGGVIEMGAYGNTPEASGPYTIGPDTTPPTITSASSTTPGTVTIVYSESVDSSSSTTTANYAIGGITISSATLAPDQKTVTLATSAHTEGTTYTLTVNNVKDMAPTPNTIAANTQKTYVLQSVLMGYWSFDDGTAADSSGNNNQGTVFGALSVDGKIGKAMQFDGVNDYIRMAETASISYAAMSAWTVSFWVKAGSLSGVDTTPYADWGTANGFRPVRFDLDSTNIWQIRTNTNTGQVDGPTVIANKWYYLAGTWSGGILNLYVDGTPYGSDTTAGATMEPDENVHTIGARGQTISDQFFNGTIDEVKIWNKALSDAEILAEYDAGSAPQPSCSDSLQNQGETGVDCGGPCTACTVPIQLYINAKALKNTYALGEFVGLSAG